MTTCIMIIVYLTRRHCTFRVKKTFITVLMRSDFKSGRELVAAREEFSRIDTYVCTNKGIR